MQINHGHRGDFQRQFFAVNVDKAGDVQIRVRTLNIFQRVLRYVFGAYKDTIWNKSKSSELKEKNPTAWKKIEAEISDSTMFKKVFKIEKTFGNKTSGKPQNSIPIPE